MKILLHICCAPCANLPIDVLQGGKDSISPAFGTTPTSTPLRSTATAATACRSMRKKIGFPLVLQDEVCP